MIEVDSFVEESEMKRALWNGAMIAESDDAVVIEGNYYFPPESVNWGFLTPSQTHSTCPWKGVASYYDILVDGKTNPDAAWYYPQPKAAAANIKDRVAFWKGVRVVDSGSAASEATHSAGGVRELVGRLLGR